MNIRKIILYYLGVEILALFVGYILLIKQVESSPDYIGMVISISCAFGFGLALYSIYLLVKKKIVRNQFLFSFLLALFGVVLPYFFLIFIMAQSH
jgi:hypothetical protein